MRRFFDEVRGAGVSLADVAQAAGANAVSADHSPQVFGIHHNSRCIEPGDIFVARRGELADGLYFVDQAVARGACAIMAERGHVPPRPLVPLLVADDIRAALARAAAEIYGQPTRVLSVVGVTGTNGKTTTCSHICSALAALGHLPASLGTLGVRFGKLAKHIGHNTPEADELTRIAAWLREQGASHLIMELTSHGLAQRRADGIRLQCGAFTNLTQDHLDLHGSLEAYGEAKARLFLELEPKSCVIMVDDPFGRRLVEQIGSPLIRVSTQPQANADICPVSRARSDASGLSCQVATPAGQVELESSLLGYHNLSNLLLALGVAVALGLDAQRVAEALALSPPVAGRLERCDEAEDDILVLVDYAHSPDALDKALQAARLLAAGRLLCVFGCGGQRDKSKRPLMGEVAGRLADVAVVTSDNPRAERPQAIADSIFEGLVTGAAKAIVELDRARAIEWAIATAAAGDVVLVAGKGHETHQVVGQQQLAFDDRKQARQALTRRRARG